MTSSIGAISIDCHHPYPLSLFWADLLGFTEDPDDPNEPEHPEARLIDPRGLHPALVFVPVPEGKTVKNRLHLDLRPSALRDVEVERVLGLGATLVDDRRRSDGTGWAVMADPEGNEFCIERSAAERDQPGSVDTGERPWTTRTGDERELLTTMLDWYREGVLTKVAGASPLTLRAAPLSSITSLAGLVNHLALVEDSWFAYRIDGQPEDPYWAGVDWDADRDFEWRTARDESLEVIVGRYRAACERSREVVARYDLDHLVTDERGREFTVRFALVHMIEETARHLGHLDILRELLDGTTGE